MNRGTQWLAVAFSCWLTWAIYITNTHHGSDALADAVAWIVHILALISLQSFRMEDQFLAELGPKTRMLKMWADVNVLAQVFLLVVTGHWWLGFLRAGSEALVRYKCDLAKDRVIGWGKHLDSFQ